jgi:hypothetical protein
MSTFNDFPYDFLTVFAVGGFLCGMAWLFARRLIRQSKWWRAVFCLLIAATITPTCFPFFGWTVAPAAVMALLVFGHSNVLAGFLYGVLPVVAVASLGLVVWSLIVSRRHRHETVA